MNDFEESSHLRELLKKATDEIKQFQENSILWDRIVSRQNEQMDIAMKALEHYSQVTNWQNGLIAREAIDKIKGIK